MCHPTSVVLIVCLLVECGGFNPLRHRLRYRKTFYCPDRPQYSKRILHTMYGYGKTDHYTWKETEDQIEIRVLFPYSTKPSDLVYRLSHDHIYLQVKDAKLPIASGRLKGHVIPSASHWYLEEGFDETVGKIKALYLYLTKRDTSKEWLGVVEGEDTVDSQPGNRPKSPVEFTTPEDRIR